MGLRRRTAMLAATAAALSVLLIAGPAGAVIGGTTDTANVFANVGVLQLNVDGDEWADFCSGTLVRADVVLTAAHCTDFLIEVGEDGFGPDDLRISFDPEGDAPFYTVDHIVVHPDWLTAAPGRGNSKHLFLAPPAEDIALVFLDAPVAGVTPAPIADADYLAGLDLTSETFTVAGYGVDAFITAVCWPTTRWSWSTAFGATVTSR
jgi:V8-like Glu-specific endopeptidase